MGNRILAENAIVSLLRLYAVLALQMAQVRSRTPHCFHASLEALCDDGIPRGLRGLRRRALNACCLCSRRHQSIGIRNVGRERQEDGWCARRVYLRLALA